MATSFSCSRQLLVSAAMNTFTPFLSPLSLKPNSKTGSLPLRPSARRPQPVAGFPVGTCPRLPSRHTSPALGVGAAAGGHGKEPHDLSVPQWPPWPAGGSDVTRGLVRAFKEPLPMQNCKRQRPLDARNSVQVSVCRDGRTGSTAIMYSWSLYYP